MRGMFSKRTRLLQMRLHWQLELFKCVYYIGNDIQ
jgi:hypothetical protein